jgi:predicted metal-dependent phosphotriesterase family hydrolase
LTRIVRTVRGEIAPGELGACDAHEHLFLVTPLQPGDELDDVAATTEEARSLVAAGAAALVEWTPLGLGRNLDGLVAGLRIVERLSSLGVSPGSVVLAHLDRNPDAGEHADTAAAGAWLQLDGPGRTKYWPDSTNLKLIAERGHADRILVGGDTGRRSIMRSYGGGPGLDYVFARFKPRLERELGGDLARRILVANPARAFAFEPR